MGLFSCRLGFTSIHPQIFKNVIIQVTVKIFLVGHLKWQRLPNWVWHALFKQKIGEKTCQVSWQTRFILMDYVIHGEIQGRSMVFFKAHCPCILPCLTWRSRNCNRKKNFNKDNWIKISMDYVIHGEIQGRSLVFFKAHCPFILPCLT